MKLQLHFKEGVDLNDAIREAYAAGNILDAARYDRGWVLDIFAYKTARTRREEIDYEKLAAEPSVQND
jgi:hypothetical protein